MKSGIVGLVLSLLTTIAIAQNNEESEYDENYEFPETRSVSVNAGIGYGIDYGLLGARLSILPVKYLAVSGAIGFTFNGPGYNGGLSFRMLPDRKVCPYLGAVYGFNTVYLHTNSDLSKNYNGFTISTGIELHRRNKPNFWNFGINVPIRSQEFRDDEENYKQDPGYIAPSPLGITVGYHFGL